MGVLRSDSLKVNTRLLREAVDVVDRSGLPGWCAERFTASLGNYRGGARARFGWRPSSSAWRWWRCPNSR